jgi:hypothetical protein
MKWFVRTSCAVAMLCAATRADADVPSHFGHGARSTALLRADIADADVTSAPVQNAAFAAEPGARVRLGYMHGFLNLRIDNHPAPVRDVAGIDAAAQIGIRLPAKFTAGFALAAHLPDTAIAHIGFRPGTEPQFFRYESVLQRASFDIAVAARRGPFAVGLGAAFALDMGGTGTSFSLGQDAQGTYADAASDISLDYRATPIVGLSVDLGRVSFGATYRGALAVGLAVDSDIRIELAENPLNGTTAIAVRGVSGYDPARFGLGTKLALHSRLSIHGALELARYSVAPPPVADVTLDVNLGTSPGRTEVEFVAPRFRDILVPRIGVEWTSANGRPGDARKDDDHRLRWALRAGYAVEPSPVPPQRGFTSYADAASHAFAAGAGVGIGRLWGVDLRGDIAGRASILVPRTERKASLSLPYATYDVTGNTFVGTISLEGAFR